MSKRTPCSKYSRRTGSTRRTDINIQGSGKLVKLACTVWLRRCGLSQ